MGDEFHNWLHKKLAEISPGCDVDVFVSYISGILETEPSVDEQLRSVCDTLEELGVSERQTHGDAIIKKWQENTQKESCIQARSSQAMTDQLSVLMGQQLTTLVDNASHHAVQSEEELQRKAAILAQYGTIVDSESSDDDGKGEDLQKSASEIGDELMQKNTNALTVVQRMREQRDEAKQQHEQKRQKDKEEMQKQKQKVNDRKDIEKKRTQKSERRR